MGCGSSKGTAVHVQKANKERNKSKIPIPKKDYKKNSNSVVVNSSKKINHTKRERQIDKDATNSEENEVTNFEGNDVTNLEEFYFPDFPTPALLQRAQGEFTVLRRDVLKKRSSNLTLPFPATGRKRDIFFVERYASIDEQAVTVALKVYLEPIEILLNTITKGTTTDLQRARAIFRWVASVDVDALNIPDTVSAGTAYHHFKRIQSNFDDHTTLFSKLCNLAGMKSIVVEGLVKGSNYKIGMRGMNSDTSFGRWAIIRVDGIWRIIDVHWGSRHTTGGSDDWLLVDDNGKLKAPEKKETIGGISTVQQCDESWFLADPTSFIYSHYPTDDVTHQLLARPVTQEEFEQMAFLKPHFFDLDLSIISHPHCLLSAQEGEILITIGFPPKRRMGFAYQLFIDGKLKENVSRLAQEMDSTKLKNFVILCQSSNELQCDIVFPIAGRYKFNLYGSDGQRGYKLACSYVINCEQAKADAVSTPSNTRNVWGPGADTEDLSLIPVSYESGIIDTDEPYVEIRFKYDVRKPVRFLHKLASDDADESSLFSHAFHRFEEDEVIFSIRLPKCGMYALNLYAKYIISEGNTLPGVCNYLIRYHGADTQEPGLPFPRIVNGELGAKRVSPDDVILTLISPLSAYMRANDTGELDITFHTSVAAVLINKLFFQNVGQDMTELENFIQVNTDGLKSVLHIIFPKPGFYHLEVYAKAKGTAGQYPKSYDCFIEVEIPKENCFPFPKFASFWDEGCKLVGPQNGLLETNRKVAFELDMPHAKDVAVIGLHDGWQHLHRDEDGMWRGEIETGDQCNSVKLSAKTSDEENMYYQVLQYEVLKEEDIQAKLSEMKKVESDAHAQSHANREKKDAKQHSVIAQIKREIMTASRNRDIGALKKAIKEAENRRLTQHLQNELVKARELLASLQRIEDLKHSVLNMDGGTMAEIRRYSKPPEGVHSVMIATLLILGDSENFSQKWQDCQVLCNSLGKNGLYRRVKGFNVEHLHPEIAMRAKEILRKYQLSDIKGVSAGAGTFYVWTKGMIEEVENREGKSNTSAADVKRQMEIFSSKKKLT